MIPLIARMRRSGLVGARQSSCLAGLPIHREAGTERGFCKVVERLLAHRGTVLGCIVIVEDMHPQPKQRVIRPLETRVFCI
jgi:hypothetical protein